MIVRKSTEIYLDSNATTPVLPEAAKAAHAAMEEIYGNPSSTHVSGLKARYLLESARDLAREVLGAHDGQVIFTSGATEAIQMGVFSTLCDLRARRQQQEDVPETPRLLLYGATEHKAVPQAIRHWNRLLGIDNDVLEIPVDAQGQLDLEFLAAHVPRADLVCTMAVNNETGVQTDLASVEATIRAHNPDVRWLVDCVQAVGKCPLELSRTTIDYASLSGHKIYAPKGIGLLYVRQGAPLVPLMAGGGQEHGARGGTENLPGVAAIAAVMQRLADSPTRTFADPQVLRGYQAQLIDALRQAFPTLQLNTPVEHSVPTTINFAVQGFPSKELLDLFDAAGIRVSSGSACGSAVQGSYVLEAMGLPRWQSDGAIRMSFGPLTTACEIEAACQRILAAGQALGDSCLVLGQEPGQVPGQRLDGLIQLKEGSLCTWLLMDSQTGHCLVVDPFPELAERTEALIRCQQSQVLAILDTHAHQDQESCRAMVLKVLQAQASPLALTDDPLGWPTESDGELELGDGSRAPFLQFTPEQVVVQVDFPGHTRLGRALLVGRPENGRLLPEQVEFAFTGDMILMGGLGRTDGPCGDPSAMYHSLRRLPRLIAPETLICPAHDYHNHFTTTLRRELDENPWLASLMAEPAGVTLEQFLEEKPRLDAEIADHQDAERMCGFIKPVPADDPSSVEIPREELREFFQQHQDSWVIDVREAHEFCFSQDWSELGFETPPRNIPLTRLSGFLPELLREYREHGRDVIFLCRSGRRSGVASSVARRLGVASARHIAGGIALNLATHCVAEEWAEPGYMI